MSTIDSVVPHSQALMISPNTTTHLTLHNSVQIPRFGLGTFRSKGSEVKNAVVWALAKGYELIDTASVYRNEEEIGIALRESGVPRERVFVSSKVSPFEQGYEPALRAVTGMIERLNCGYLDLCLIHWPGAAKLAIKSPKNRELRLETWRALEDSYKEGKCRSIGVSNYTERHLQELLDNCTVRPMVNQVELHPYLTQPRLRKFSAEKDVVVQAYSPLGVGELLDDSVVCAVAARHNRTPAQVLLRWGIQHDLVVIPKSVTKERIEANADIFDFVLPADDMTQLDSLERNQHFCWSPQDVL